MLARARFFFVQEGWRSAIAPPAEARAAGIPRSSPRFRPLMWLGSLAMSGCSSAVVLGRSCEPFGVNDFAPNIPWPCGRLKKRSLQGIDGRSVRIKLLLTRRERGWLAHMGTVRGSCGQWRPRPSTFKTPVSRACKKGCFYLVCLHFGMGEP